MRTDFVAREVVTGLLRQSAVLGALTGKSPASGKRMFGQSR